jgi:predicted nucleic acid-binding protein
LPLQRVVVDASAALKWVLEEEGSPDAVQLLDRDVLHAPDFLLLEVANVLWTKARRGALSRSDADVAFQTLAAVPIALTPLAELIRPARSLAFALDLTVYDAVYAALAQRLDCPLATADETLAKAMTAAGMTGSAQLIR